MQEMEVCVHKQHFGTLKDAGRVLVCKICGHEYQNPQPVETVFIEEIVGGMELLRKLFQDKNRDECEFQRRLIQVRTILELVDRTRERAKEPVRSVFENALNELAYLTELRHKPPTSIDEAMLMLRRRVELMYFGRHH